MLFCMNIFTEELHLLLGGEFNSVSFNPLEGIVCDCSPPNSEYASLYKSLISLSPNILLGIPGIYILKNEINSFRKNKKISSRFLGVLNMGIASLGYIPLGYSTGDVFGLGGGDFYTAGENLREFFYMQFPYIKHAFGEITKTTQTLVAVGFSLSTSLLGYKVIDKVLKGIRNLHKTKYLNI